MASSTGSPDADPAARPRRRSGRGPSTGDVVAGVSVALVAIPQSLAYAELAGVPAHHGLFASALPSVAAAFFASSRQLQTGAVALTALLTFGALADQAPVGTEEFARLAALLALLVGGFRLLLGLVRLGRSAYLLSEPVLIGFTTGAGILIVASQLPRLFDVTDDGDGVLAGAVRAVGSIDRWRPSALVFAGATAAVVLGGRRLHRLFPGVLLAVAAAIVAAGLVGYEGSTTGDLDTGFVRLDLDLPWGSTTDLLIPALVIALVGFAEPASIARTFAVRDRQPWNANREMISQGVANMVSGLTRGFPVGGSFSRSALNRMAGATSPWAGAITGLCVLLALPATPLLADLPLAVLSTIVVVSVIGLLRVDQVIGLIRRNRAQGLVAGGTLVATLVSAPRIQWGVLIGIGLALLVHLFRELAITAESVLADGRLVVRPKGVLWFATIASVDDLIRQHLDGDDDPTMVVFDLDGVGRLDYSAAAALARLIDELEEAGVAVRIVNVQPGAARAARIHLPDHLPPSTGARPPAQPTGGPTR